MNGFLGSVTHKRNRLILVSSSHVLETNTIALRSEVDLNLEITVFAQLDKEELL